MSVPHYHNSVYLQGYLGKDPQLEWLGKKPGEGSPFVLLQIAINRYWRDRDGRERKDLYWADVICWLDLEAILELFHKGDPVAVTGHLSLRKHEYHGFTYRTTQIVAQHVYKPAIKKRPPGEDDEDRAHTQPLSQLPKPMPY